MKASRHQLTAIALAVAGAAAVGAQSGIVPAARVSVLVAENQRAPTAQDLATLRTGVRSANTQTARLAIRALGRLERPALIADLLPVLRVRLPETRAEAANAIGQAARGWTAGAKSGVHTPASVLSALVARLEVEEEPAVRAALCETIGRLPYGDADALAARAEAALVALVGRSDTVNDRLGAAKGLEALTRINKERRRPSAAAVEALRVLSGMPAAAARAADDAIETRVADISPTPPGLEPDPLRDSRVRRLALETLIAAEIADADVVARAAADVDAQVRRLAMRADAASGDGGRLVAGLADPAAMVRLEALRGLLARRDPGACDASIEAASDVDPRVALLALDQLGLCGAHPAAVALLERVATDRAPAGLPRGWHRGAHALVALASAAPDRAAAAIASFVTSPIWQERVYAARAAVARLDRAVLEKLAVDADDNVVEAAVTGLVAVGGHAGDPLYLAALARSGYQAVRAAALALDGTPAPAVAVPALQRALQRLVDEGRDNSADTRAALAATLASLGAPPTPRPPAGGAASASELNAAELRRLAAPRARVVVRDVGTFDLALFTSEAPATVLRFAALAEAGYYDGLTFHRVVPNFVIQGGSPGANEYIGDRRHMRDEVGLWPHVRGTVGISTRGRDTGDAQIFINLVDNPRFDHEYTVFAQLLNGIDVVDRILEGDVIERIDIIP